MSSAHNLPGMAATPHFTKKIGELGLNGSYNKYLTIMKSIVNSK